MKISSANHSFATEEVIKFLSLSGRSKLIFPEIITQKMVHAKAQELGLSVTVEELQKFADQYRILHGLHSAGDTHAFFKTIGITENDFEAYCESSLLLNAVKEALAPEEKIKEYYFENRANFDSAKISWIISDNKNMANELFMQITEDDQDFRELAREYSIDVDTRYQGGFIGILGRESFPAEEEAKVFGAKPGDVIGPFPRNGHFILIWVEEIFKSELNSHVKEIIKNHLFQEWQKEFLQAGFQIIA